jgi:hypothetical protein
MRIGFEEHVSSPYLLRRALQFFHHPVQRVSFLICQTPNILFFYGNPPWYSPVSLMGPIEGTLIFKIDRALDAHLMSVPVRGQASSGRYDPRGFEYRLCSL